MPRERRAECRACGYFRNDPAYLESLLNGFAGLGSAYGSTRADDGICERHGRFVGPRGACADFAASGEGVRGEPPRHSDQPLVAVPGAEELHADRHALDREERQR
jgi:hypothetical protein